MNFLQNLSETNPGLFMGSIIGIFFLSILGLFILVRLIRIIINEIDLVKTSYFGWKKIRHDLGTYYLILEWSNGNSYDIKISKYPFSKFFLKLGNREQSISLVKGKISEYELTNIKDYVNKFIIDYNDFINKKDVLLEWDGNLLSKKGQRKENIDKILN